METSCTVGLKGRGFSSLRLRLIFYLLLPVTLLLVALGVAGFFYARGYLMDQLRQTSLLGLQRAAHSIDMRLAQPGEASELLNTLEGLSQNTISEWESHLGSLPGVARVKLTWLGPAESPRPMMGGRGGSMGGWAARGMHRVTLSKVSNPRYDTNSGQQTVSLVFDLMDPENQITGRLEVVMRFSYLLEGLRVFEQWKSERAFLVDGTGRVLAQGGSGPRLERLGEKGDPFELKVLEGLLTKPAGTLYGPGHPAHEVAGFFRLKEAPWTLVLFARGEKVLAPIIRFMTHYIVAGTVVLVLVVLIILVVTGRMAGSVRTVCQAARRVAQGDYVEVPTPQSRDEFRRLADSFNTMVEGLKQKDYLRDTFSRYVDPHVASRLMSRPEATALGGDKRLVAIMMTDVRGFTPLAERLSPEQTITIINRYLSVLIEVISAGQGIIVDFLGDALLAFFDSLESGPRQAAEQAVCCALELRRATEEFNQQMRAEGLPDLATGIGLHAGEVVVGNIGSFTRTKYGIVGGPVNLTNRIQAQAEGGEIIASQAVVDLIGPELKVSRGFEALLKGVEGQVQLYALKDLPSCQPEHQA
ncbi:MAG: adenylate/guanylate cyclase domain-containing protein [Thermodesulfobacteriota bacterium]